MELRKLVWVALYAGAACGQEPPTIHASLSIAQGLQAETRSLAIYALGSLRDDDIFLTCNSLLQFDIQPTDPKVDTLATKNVDPPFSKPVSLGEVESGDRRILYVAAVDLGGLVIGNGCADEITVPDGGTVDVTVRVYEVR